MIHIIKPGKIEPRYAFCPECHCEFTYELADLNDSYAGNYVSCPCCSFKILDNIKYSSIDPDKKLPNICSVNKSEQCRYFIKEQNRCSGTKDCDIVWCEGCADRCETKLFACEEKE